LDHWGWFRVARPWELLYADDLVATAETEDDLTKRLNEWKDKLENRCMGMIIKRVSVIPKKTSVENRHNG